MSAAEPRRAPLLSVENLDVRFQTEGGVVHAVDDVSFSLSAGQILGIVGESGSGKSVTAMSLIGLTRGPNTTVGGRVMIDDTDLVAASERELEAVRGKRIAMIFQDPMSALNPVLTIGAQIVEQIRAHEPVSRAIARERAVDLLGRVGIPRPAERVGDYPHEFSGGMRQRVMIAMALSCSPEILVADEPTTALDVTIQSQILEDIRGLCTDTGVSVLLITHDLGVIAGIADQLLVMYAGQVVEQGSLDEIFYDPQHPYTWGLLGSVPRLDLDRPERLPTIAGSPPSLASPPSGCRFGPRCPWRFDACTQPPPLATTDATWTHLHRCLLPQDLRRDRRLVDGAIGLPAMPGLTRA